MKTFASANIYSQNPVFIGARSGPRKHLLPSSIRHLLSSIFHLLFWTSIAFGQSADYAASKAAAEKFYADGSYAKAHEAYAKIDVSTLPASDARWVAFRLADTQWRSAAATDNPDTSQQDAARDSLAQQVRDLTREDQHDRIWAEVEESLGDFYWGRANSDWNSALPYYQAALDWWAGQSDLDLARGRYLNIVWKMARPPASLPSYLSYGDWGYTVPMDILDNAAKIAQTDEDKAHAHYLIAMTLRWQWDGWQQKARVPREFEQAIHAGKKTNWYDAALFNYAQWLEQNGRPTMDKDGNWSSQPDYVTVLGLYRQLTNNYAQGESRYWEQATNEIGNITGSQVNISTENIFLPDSEIQYTLFSRNVKEIRLALYPVNLNEAVNYPPTFKSPMSWLQTIDLNRLKAFKRWTREVEDHGEYIPTNAIVRLGRKLKPGAYVLEAQAGGQSSRDLVLVSDAALVFKSSDRQGLVYFCNAINSAPMTNAPVKLWETWNDEHSLWHSRSFDGLTDSNGIAVISFSRKVDANITFYAAARSGDRQAFVTEDNYNNGDDESAGWNIYAFTDRPAYRPNETVQWKFIARRYNGAVYSTPSGRTIEYEILDPRGTKVKSDKIKLNEFGSAWGTLDLTEKMPLGEYQINFWNQGHHREIGDATLFRLEEYKLPEFKVTVQTPEENGKKETFRLGDTVEATIQADYYFGGPVANADVNVVVQQKPFMHFWHEPRDYPWLYDDMDTASPFGGWNGGGQTITNAMLKTDATGKATLTFATPQNSGNDFEYDIEARVTDASRREITGNGSVRVTSQSYYVNAKAAHNLYLPQDKVTVNFKALDANDDPVQVEGDVKVTRDYWYEIWRAPDGHEVKGNELKHLQAKYKTWPPPPARPDQKDWELKFKGYEHDDILTRHLTTDTNGDAELSFRPERKGYYHITWMGRDAPANHQPQPITADATIWAVNNRTMELGYRSGGVEIIADKDTFHVDGTAPVMLVAPTADRYVLFTVEGQGIYHCQLVHMDGTVKLVNLAIDESYVPNVFLDATLVSDRQIFTDEKQIVVPPVKNFLNVQVKADRSNYEPRDKGTLTVTTKNDKGEPVPAEVALSLADESVFYIQDDYAGDPRQFFFGTKRNQQIQTQSTMNQKSYAELVKWKGRLIDEKDEERLEEQNRTGRLTQDVAGIIPQTGIGDGGGGSEMYSQNVVGYVNVNMPSPGGGLLYATSDAIRPGASAITFGGRAGREWTLGQIPVMGHLFKENLAYRGGSSPGQPAVVVRNDFRSTVFWQPDVMTDRNGEATVQVTYPDSLTSWRATARAVTAANQFGIAETTTRTRQPLIVRLEGPRFYVVGDTVTVSAVVNNNTDRPIDANVSLDASGLDVEQSSETPTVVNVPANGEARADWTARVESPGDVKLKVTARSEQYADAMENTFTAYEHGIEKFISKSGKTRSDETTVELVLPHERKTASTSLTVQVTPSMAVTMLDALPYLINYPYGCTEQTMSRFLPTVITAKTLRDLGVQPADVMGRVFGGIETNTVTATHPEGKQSLDEMNQMTQDSLDRLYSFQHDDGGWGWWKDDDSDHWMTAYVVWGLALARDAGVHLKQGVLLHGVTYLNRQLVDEKDNYDMQAFMLHALASCHPRRINKFQRAAFNNLWKNRDQLNAYSRAMLALGAHEYGFDDRAKILVANLENGVIRDDRPDQSILMGNNSSQTSSSPTIMAMAHWGSEGDFWHWSDSGVESTAFALRALMAIDPTNRLVEPVANWLIKNRRGAQWNNTRDTAIAVLALNDYLRASGELQSDTTFKIYVNGSQVAERHISGADIFNAPSQFTVDPKLIQDTNEVRIVRTDGNGPLYFSANSSFFSTEDPITPAGNEIFVKREYYKLVPRPTLLRGYVDDREPLLDGGTVQSGERIETLITVEAKNDYDYLMFEDLKPAGFEAVEVRSGGSLDAMELKSSAAARKFPALNRVSISPMQPVQKIAMPMIPAPQPQEDSDYTGRTCGVYEELRDRQVALFMDHLPQGVWEIRYDVRAETPGKFHALPVVGGAMYVPEIRCNSAETRVEVLEDGR
ncbi:MAG TPA: alpha-2-macroglobulin family protein [Candidatus Sulfotelmatobacter sp.]|nr:alpha-2-macroglobulin family protein [Candidatus Sulfotelmatobacter sp.]